MSAGEDLGTALARLERASRHHLAELWAACFGTAPPPRTSRALMIRAVAYKMQERELGGLSAATRRLLSDAGGGAAQRRALRPGTVLIREWHGVAHQVTVGEEGVLYRGECYRSLSEVARLITGARWSALLRAEGVIGKAALRRCAVYTRKSSEEGLEQDFNALHAQREACEAFIRSQRGEGGRLIETAYDDGGLSGGTLERPALQHLLADIAQHRVDTVVVYKIDRLTRSLMDFAKLVELFDRHGVTFVAVTQQFNTTTSMGRLTLNILLSFAQFEREVIGERVRDKIAASKQKGMWMGSVAPLGYEIRDRKLVIRPEEAETVRLIFRRYLELGSVRLLKQELDQTGVRSKQRTRRDGSRIGGQPFSRGALYALLSKPIYIGEIAHKGARYPGMHEAILDRVIWDAVQDRLRDGAPDRTRPAAPSESPLMGKLFDEAGHRLTPTRAAKGGRRYRYYVSHTLVTGTAGQAPGAWRLPAA